MKKNPLQPDNDEIKELLKQFRNLQNGRGNSFLNEDAFEKIIDYFDEIESLPNAIEAVELGIEQYPYSSALLVKKADLMIATRQYDKALDILEKAELLDGSDINIYILKTDAYLALDKQAKAVSLLENALKHFEGAERIELLFELADVYDDYEEFDKIFDCLQLILEEDPNNEEALYKICFWTDFTGRNEESIKLHQKIIDDFPYNELAWFNLAAAYQGLKLYEKAIDAYKYSVVIDEKLDYAYRNMADAYIRLRKFRDAIESLEKVIELSRPEDVIYEAIGHCYDKLRNYAQALVFIIAKHHILMQTTANFIIKLPAHISTKPSGKMPLSNLKMPCVFLQNNQSIISRLGSVKCSSEIFRDAVQYFSNVVRVRPKNVAGWDALIRCLYTGGFFEEALEQAQSAARITNGKAVFIFYSCAICFALGKTKEGLLQLEKAYVEISKVAEKTY